ncbi:hypothetical protein V6Z11_A05G404500 [Gossypium hirsutum]
MRKWERVTMDFVSGLPLTLTKKVVDRLTKSAHFIPVRTDFSLQKLANLYIYEIVRLYGVPLSIISDKDPRFTSRFWEKLHKALGSRLDFSTAFHPQIDGQSERVIQILEDMLRGCVINFRGNWEELLPLAEFAYNNSYHLVYRWHHMRHFMVVSIALLCVGLSWVSGVFWVQSWFQRLRIRSI